MKQTAVEWLIDEWLHLDAEFDMVLIDKKIYWEKLKEKQNQAKEMEKQQIIDAFSWNVYGEDNRRDGEQYYTETFKSK
jgi:hypothetical protein